MSSITEEDILILKQIYETKQRKSFNTLKNQTKDRLFYIYHSIKTVYSSKNEYGLYNISKNIGYTLKKIDNIGIIEKKEECYDNEMKILLCGETKDYNQYLVAIFINTYLEEHIIDENVCSNDNIFSNSHIIFLKSEDHESEYMTNVKDEQEIEIKVKIINGLENTNNLVTFIYAPIISDNSSSYGSNSYNSNNSNSLQNFNSSMNSSSSKFFNMSTYSLIKVRLKDEIIKIAKYVDKIFFLFGDDYAEKSLNKSIVESQRKYLLEVFYQLVKYLPKNKIHFFLYQCQFNRNDKYNSNNNNDDNNKLIENIRSSLEKQVEDYNVAYSTNFTFNQEIININSKNSLNKSVQMDLRVINDIIKDYLVNKSFLNIKLLQENTIELLSSINKQLADHKNIEMKNDKNNSLARIILTIPFIFSFILIIWLILPNFIMPLELTSIIESDKIMLIIVLITIISTIIASNIWSKNVLMSKEKYFNLQKYKKYLDNNTTRLIKELQISSSSL